MRSIRYLAVSVITSASAFKLILSNASRYSFLLSEREGTHREILSQLDEVYKYEGRLPSGGQDHRCGFACIVGAPNMGKSTLMNALLETDLCVATRRPQTTRHAILGVVTDENRQLCLVDTPGVIGEPAYKLQEGMMEAVMGAFHDSDVLIVVTDLFSTPIPDDNLFHKVQRSNKPVIVAVNKIDLATRVNAIENQEEDRTLTVEGAIARWRSLLPEALIILPISACDGPNGAGVDVLRRILMGKENVSSALRGLGRPIAGMFREGMNTLTDFVCQEILPIGPPLYDRDTLTDRSERFFSSEIIRASLFENLRKEVPYCCEVRIESFKEPKENERKPIVQIAASVVVERESQKGIVVGKGGENIKKIGVEAREKLEEFLEAKVFLELKVRVEKDWRKSEEVLKKYGYLR